MNEGIGRKEERKERQVHRMAVRVTQVTSGTDIRTYLAKDVQLFIIRQVTAQQVLRVLL